MKRSSLSHISWYSHLWALLAIARKDFLHFTRYPLNAVFRVIQPIMWLTPIYFLGQTFKGAGGNTGFAAYSGTGDYMSFILVGAVLSSYINSVFWGIGYSLKREMDSGVLESNWLTPIPRFSHLIGRTLADLLINTIVNIGILALGWLFFGFSVTGDLLPAIGIVLPMLLALYGFGFAFAGAVLLMREANTLVDVSSYLVSILSGAQFPVQVLPAILLPIALALPLTYGFDAVRGLLINTVTLLPIRYELAILGLFMVVTVPLGYFVFRRVERRCQRLGTIGMH